MISWYLSVLFCLLSNNTDGRFDDSYRFGFNGQQKDNEIAGVGNSLDFGNRMFDSRLARFTSRDRLTNEFPSFSPYLFAANTPVNAIDLNGDKVYILAYTTGETKNKNDMFRASAFTRKYDIEHNKDFNPKTDKVEMIQITDLAQLKNQIAEIVAKDQPQYGKTTEFGVYSHAGRTDGPIGRVVY